MRQALTPCRIYQYGAADISHDGTRVAYIAGYTELRVLNVATGETVPLDANAWTPRWSASGDRIAFLVPSTSCCGGSIATVINADGTGRRPLGSSLFSPGLAWSPDGAYIIGRTSEGGALRLLRVSDAMEVLVRFRSEDYFQPDWR